ncbi:MAG: monovalent cation/H(+) antiporter subunit G [bacterium]|nr:monovalent cation/H(+) antiporter subunit G [bacterium]
MIDIISFVLIGLGLVFFLGTAVGLLRFPDFYTRMHAAGKGDTLSTLLILLGLALLNLHDFHHISLGTVLVSIKIILIGIFIYIGSPTATHAIFDAGLRTGKDYWKKDKDVPS